MTIPMFHDPLDLRAYKHKRWKLLGEYKYTTGIFGSAKDITVRKGFITDLASIPRVVRSLIPQVGRHRGAAVVHDWLYHTAADHKYSRLQCDQVFLEAMKCAGVSWWKRQAMFSAVRVGGFLFWNKSKKIKQ